MAKTWFITGCSSGFGYEMSKLILENDGRLIATARKTDKIKEWEAQYPGRVLVLPMDVTDSNTVQEAVQKALAFFPTIDVLINNAGYGIAGAMEEVSDAEIRKIFDTNVFGLLHVTRAKPLGIRVIIIEPGGFRTSWGGASMAFAEKSIDDYNDSSGGAKSFFKSSAMPDVAGGDPKKLAAVVIEIALEKTPPLRLALGDDCYKGIQRKMQKMNDELEQWKEVTQSTGY